MSGPRYAGPQRPRYVASGSCRCSALRLGPLFDELVALGYDAHEFWAWDHYKSTILALARRLRDQRGGTVRLLEIGGGRDPAFHPEQAHAAGLAVTVNDIDAGELARAPRDFAKMQFDIAGDLSAAGARLGGYDLIISHMVFEHVADAKAWRNSYALLSPGGRALAFFPTPLCPPFVINKLAPESLSQRILKTFFPIRNSAIPKFPAHYHWCSGNQRVLEPRLAEIGFRVVSIVPWTTATSATFRWCATSITPFRCWQEPATGAVSPATPTRSFKSKRSHRCRAS